MSDSTSTDAALVLASLGTVIQQMRRRPLSFSSVQPGPLGPKPKPRHVAALLQIAGSEQMSVSALAERLQISLATASQLVSELADLGLVERVEDPGDRRRTLIVVSASHQPLIDEVLDARLRPLDEALSRLSPAERNGLCSGLQRLASELESADSESKHSPSIRPAGSQIPASPDAHAHASSARAEDLVS